MSKTFGHKKNSKEDDVFSEGKEELETTPVKSKSLRNITSRSPESEINGGSPPKCHFDYYKLKSKSLGGDVPG